MKHIIALIAGLTLFVQPGFAGKIAERLPPENWSVGVGKKTDRLPPLDTGIAKKEDRTDVFVATMRGPLLYEAPSIPGGVTERGNLQLMK